MATDSTLQKIADNLLAQFDKTLLDNSTDFSSCDQILNSAPSEHKGGLESLYCDLLLDALISGYYRYSEMDTKQLVDDPLYTKFKKMVYGLDRSDPYNLLYYAIIDLVSGKKENVAVKGQRVFGIICLNDPTKDLIEKVKADDQMRLFEYSISYSEII